jgi:hypothetical protein
VILKMPQKVIGKNVFANLSFSFTHLVSRFSCNFLGPVSKPLQRMLNQAQILRFETHIEFVERKKCVILAFFTHFQCKCAKHGTFSTI